MRRLREVRRRRVLAHPGRRAPAGRCVLCPPSPSFHVLSPMALCVFYFLPEFEW
jgi:hypothetical protein